VITACYHSAAAGRMHFVKFETARIQDCIDFIQAKGLHRCWLRDGSSREVRVKATGGGAIRFAGGWCPSLCKPRNVFGGDVLLCHCCWLMGSRSRSRAWPM
jgi:hypothetical protein